MIVLARIAACVAERSRGRADARKIQLFFRIVLDIQ